MAENTPSSLATAAVVVSCNGLQLLEQNLPSLQQQSTPFRRILVVDNNSQDDSRRFVESLEGIELIAMQTNLGFAAANNRAIEQALADTTVEVIATINNDVRLAPNWHQEALTALRDREPQATADPVGAVATLVLQARHPDLIDSAGITWDDTGRASNRWHGANRQRAQAAAPVSEVWGASAAAALYSRGLLREVGAFDESFFAYQEDVDLALRSKHAGFRCNFARRAEGWHLGQGSDRRFPLGGTRADFLNARNRVSVMTSARLHGQAAGPMLQSLTLDLLRSVRRRNAPAVWSGVALGLLRQLSRRQPQTQLHQQSAVALQRTKRS